MERKTASNKYYEIILDWFKQQLMSGELKEGDVIPSERELAARFGVSRVPVREALRILEYIGIVSNEPDGLKVQKVDVHFLNPKANFASEITIETLEKLFEVRIFLESAAAYYAARRRTDEDIALMRESIRRMADTLDSDSRNSEQMIQASHDFHFHVIAAAKNFVLDNIYRNLYELLEVSKQHTLNPSQVSETSLLEHEAILYKIESGNAEEASKYMKYHLSTAIKKLTSPNEINSFE